MVKTLSTMMPLATVAPKFKLFDTTTGKNRSLDELKSDTATVIAFICNHCPFVKLIQDEFAQFASEYQAKGISVIAISSNDVANYPDDAPDKMTQEALDHNYTFPYLYDETQDVAKAYGAVCTPDFFIFDKDLKCVYRGQFDSARPGNGKPVNGADMRAALDNILAGKPVSEEQFPSMGCNIKWKS